MRWRMKSKSRRRITVTVTSNQWAVDEWAGCYPSNWKGAVVTEAMTHPAKFSSRLIRRIYDHMLGEGWVKAGDGVIDPFGGVALGALDAMRLGLHWSGVELEEKFWKIGNANIEKWVREFEIMPGWGTARLLHGDSRKLLDVVEGAKVESFVSSPPYGDQGVNFSDNRLVYDGKEYRRPYMEGQEKNYGPTEGQLSAMKTDGFSVALSSPPYAETPINQTHMTSNRRGDPNNPNYRPSWKKKLEEGYAESVRPYGETEGQLGSMKADEESYTLAVSSPPFLQSEGGTPEPKAGGVIDKALYERHKAGNKKAGGYGETEGQLHHMPSGSFDVAVSSPPFMQQEKGGGIAAAMRGEEYNMTTSLPGTNSGYQNQAFTVGNLAEVDANDFWIAARQIVEQVYAALEPGGHACWVVKDYVKNKQVVPFSDQWRQLCEAVGFVTLHEHRAMLVHRKGKQGTLDGGSVEIKTESKSFFRRLAEKKGSPRIDWEVVWCMVKA